MNLYFAPLEGIGGYIYRNAQADFFPEADRYFSPFLSPGTGKRLTPREYRDIAPEHNEKIHLVPQIMTDHAESFLRTAHELQSLGYEEVNLNLGCPSRTVVTKGRGAGFLAYPEKLDAFLYDIFAKTDVAVSVKTRIGMEEPEEFLRLLEIFNRYPISELIIHPRLQTDYYKNHPDMEIFSYAAEHTKLPLVYNGDLFSVSDVRRFSENYPEVGTVMLGRGALCDPALFGEARAAFSEPSRHGTEKSHLTKERLRAFHDRLLSDYAEVLSGEKPLLYKMKEIWFYMSHVFTNHESYEKKIRKAMRLSDYRVVVNQLFVEEELHISDFDG
ncbi:MAG: tRNA-dihydrouridine synthase family protein [Clostridiales bacterium]|nr:tRNA-dihydrouridine synthase family protein [Clostridiales bacterium]